MQIELKMRISQVIEEAFKEVVTFSRDNRNEFDIIWRVLEKKFGELTQDPVFFQTLAELIGEGKILLSCKQIETIDSVLYTLQISLPK